MLKIILRALFKPSYRPKNKRFNKPRPDPLFDRADRSTTVPDGIGSDPIAKRPVFDEASATSVQIPVILEGPAYVTDGDTITIQKTQIRLYGIDAPEMNHPYGKRAKWAMVHLCKGQCIRAEVTDVDAHGRTVAKCFLPDGRDLSAELVKQGLAIDWPKYSGGQYSHLEVAGIRKKLWLADARQKGQMHVWEKFDAKNSKQTTDS